MSAQNTVQVEQEDALIVLRPDGSFEASLPDVTTDQVPEHIMMGAAVLYALNTPGMVAWLQDSFRDYCTGVDSSGTSQNPANN
ncbi:MAG: hypothetical protein GY915_09120 [bacterium]|nr:hypothetical protein [bacterium]